MEGRCCVCIPWHFCEGQRTTFRVLSLLLLFFPGNEWRFSVLKRSLLLLFFTPKPSQQPYIYIFFLKNFSEWYHLPIIVVFVWLPAPNGVCLGEKRGKVIFVRGSGLPTSLESNSAFFFFLLWFVSILRQGLKKLPIHYVVLDDLELLSLNIFVFYLSTCPSGIQNSAVVSSLSSPVCLRSCSPLSWLLLATDTLQTLSIFLTPVMHFYLERHLNRVSSLVLMKRFLLGVAACPLISVLKRLRRGDHESETSQWATHWVSVTNSQSNKRGNREIA